MRSRLPTGSIHNREQGTSAVEMAVVAPLLFLLLFGIIEFGFLFNRWITITHASREGVRQMSVGQEADDAEASAVNAAGPQIGNTITCDGSTPSDSTVQMVCSTDYTLELFFFNAPVDLSSTARMSKE